jgi:sulfide:quinone oxidoreductase
MAAENPGPRNVVIVGGGVAGLEATLALGHLAGDDVALHLIDGEPDFTYRALSVEEPFSGRPAERRELAPALAALGGSFTLGRVTGFDVEGHVVEVEGSGRIAYDTLVVCLGARTGPALPEPVHTLRPDRADLPVERLLETAHESESNTLALVAPPANSWALPLYELALMFRSRSEAIDLSGLRIAIFTPEDRPLDAFGATPSGVVADLLAARRIEFNGSSYVIESDVGLHVMPREHPLEAGAVVALQALHGPALAGLPADDDGYIPVDEFGRVEGLEDVYAAGDGTNFPVKQGGLAAQQADAVAAHIAAGLGAGVEALPFEPVLRAQLLTGADSLYFVHELTGGHGDGVVSSDILWSPPEKVAGRYLAAWLRDLPVPSWASEDDLAGS